MRGLYIGLREAAVHRWRIAVEFLSRASKVAVAAVYLLTFVLTLIGVPQQANAASIVYEASTTATTNSGTSVTINKPTGTTSNDVMVAIIGVQGTSPTITSSSSLFTSTSLKSTNTNVTIESFYRRAGGSEGSNYTFNISTSATRISAAIILYRGVATSGNPVEASTTSSSGTDSTLEVNSFGGSPPTTSQSRIIQIYAMENAAPRTFTPATTSGVNERVDTATSDGSNNDVSIELTDFAQAVAGDFQPNSPAPSTASGTGNWAAHQLSIKPDTTSHMLLFWDGGGSAPTGWSYVTEAEGSWVRGEVAANYGGIGGSPTHAPTASVTISAASGNDPGGNGGQNNVAAQTHTHGFEAGNSTGITASGESNERANRTLRLIRYDAGVPNVIPAGAITIFDGSPGIPSSGWTSLSAASEVFNGRFVKISATAGTNSGTDTHVHTLDWAALTSSSGVTQRAPLVFNVATASAPHTHGDPSDTTTSTNGTSTADCDLATVDNTCLPQHVQVLLAKADADTNVLSIGITAMFDGEPGGGWVVRSESGGPYYQRFLRGGATYTEGLGALTHEHANATSGVSNTDPEGSGGTAEDLGTGAAADNHTHISTSDFAAVDHTPPYYNVVVGEKVNFILNHYAWYDDPNTSANTVSSRYSSLDVLEDSEIDPIPVGYNPPDINDELRLRVQVLVNNSSLADDEIAFKLQFREETNTSLTSTSCTTGSWTDVADNGGGSAWKYAPTTPPSGSHPTDGNQLTGTTVFSSGSTSLQRYIRSNNTAFKNIGTVASGGTMEWDYHVVNASANPATKYRFRLVEDSGILLSQYGYTGGGGSVTPLCPALTTKPQPVNQLRHGNFFDNTGTEKGYSWVD